MARLGTRTLIAATLLGGIAGAIIAAGTDRLFHILHPPAGDLHTLLHRDVPLSAAEEERLKAKEDAYTQRRQGIEQRFMAANGRLAAAIESNPRWSPDVEAATREVESAAAELQRATLEHVFETREGLDPDHRPAYDQALVSALKRGAK